MVSLEAINLPVHTRLRSLSKARKPLAFFFPARLKIVVDQAFLSPFSPLKGRPEIFLTPSNVPNVLSSEEKERHPPFSFFWMRGL